MKRGKCMENKKILCEGNHRNIVYPSENEALRIIKNMHGYDSIMFKYQNSLPRICRVKRKMKKCNRIREDDLVFESPQKFQSDERSGIFWRAKSSQMDKFEGKSLFDIARG